MQAMMGMMGMMSNISCAPACREEHFEIGHSFTLMSDAMLQQVSAARQMPGNITKEDVVMLELYFPSFMTEVGRNS